MATTKEITSDTQGRLCGLDLVLLFQLRFMISSAKSSYQDSTLNRTESPCLWGPLHTEEEKQQTNMPVLEGMFYKERKGQGNVIRSNCQKDWGKEAIKSGQRHTSSAQASLELMNDSAMERSTDAWMI